MQNAETVLDVLRERGRRGLPLHELYRQLFNPQLYLLAYGRIYSNKGAMTPGPDAETADGMTLGKIERIIDALRHERYRFKPVRRHYIPKKDAAPRGALLYPRRSREELEGMFLGPMAYPDPKGERNNRMPDKRRSGSGARAEASRDPRDMAKATLPDSPISSRRNLASAGKAPETGATPCDGIPSLPTQPSERGALPSEGNQGDEWDA